MIFPFSALPGIVCALAAALWCRAALAVGAGYRWRAFTPCAGDSTMPARSDTSGLALAGSGAALDAALNQIPTTLPEQSTASVGMRWDGLANIALKRQCERVTAQGSSRATLKNTPPGFVSGGPVNLTSSTLDFVF